MGLLSAAEEEDAPGVAYWHKHLVTLYEKAISSAKAKARKSR